MKHLGIVILVAAVATLGLTLSLSAPAEAQWRGDRSYQGRHQGYQGAGWRQEQDWGPGPDGYREPAGPGWRQGYQDRGWRQEPGWYQDRDGRRGYHHRGGYGHHGGGHW
jgi:hypothetical protein